MSALLPANESNTDRILRAIGGTLLLSLLAIGPVPGWGLFGLVGIVLLGTAAMGSCPMYTLLGISSCPMNTNED